MLTVLSTFLLSTQNAHADRQILVAWHDEFRRANLWAPLAMNNMANLASNRKGTLALSLKQVPPDWPYSYQWSGASRRASVDAQTFPVLMAHVTELHGYAHVDVDVLGSHGEVAKSLRSTTLLSPGVATLDLTTDRLGKADLRIRLIVGGPNTGCRATYNWVRFVQVRDKDFLLAHPDFGRVVVSKAKKGRVP